jgi:hypothetical protein
MVLLMVARYCVLPARETAGMKVALLPKTMTVPPTAAPPTTLASLKVEVVTVEGVMASANVAVTAAFNATAVAPLLGAVEDTVGGLPSATPDAGAPVEESALDPPPPPHPASPDNANAVAIKSAKRFRETANRRIDIELELIQQVMGWHFLLRQNLKDGTLQLPDARSGKRAVLHPDQEMLISLFEGAYCNGCASDKLPRTLSQLANASEK